MALWQVLLEILGVVGALTGTGTLLYLLIDKKVLSKGEKAQAEGQEKDNQAKDVDTGLNAINFYKEIREVVNEELKEAQKPLIDELILVKGQFEDVKTELKTIKDNWCCYRDRCEMRIRSAQDAVVDDKTHGKDFIDKMGS